MPSSLLAVPEQTTSSIDIGAAPDVVMAVIADLERYPEWVDSMRSTKVLSIVDGRPEQVAMELAHPLIRDHYVLAYQWEPLRVSWHLVKGSVLKAMDGSYTLAPRGDGCTVTYALSVDANLPMIGLLRRKAEQTIIAAALRGLQRRVEG
jgi:ribosome-associated toxin RatA of RatAB toxin-antitoxin module